MQVIYKHKKQKPRKPYAYGVLTGDPSQIRTADTLIKSHTCEDFQHFNGHQNYIKPLFSSQSVSDFSVHF